MNSNYTSMVIGATGLVGSCLMSKLPDRTLGTYYSQPLADYTHLDIRDSHAVDELICSAQPLVIYCPAARPGVDYCQQHPRESYAVNVAGIENVARAARKIDALMVFFSSDYIFDGRDGPYHELDAPNPICVYMVGNLPERISCSDWSTRSETANSFPSPAIRLDHLLMLPV